MAEIFDFGLQQHKIKMDGKFFENNLFAVAGDTGRRLEVQLLDSDNLVQDTTGISLRLNADVAGQATYAEATLVDAIKGLYELDLPNGMLIAPGNWQFQWQIIGANGEKLHSFAFMGTIGSNLAEGAAEGLNFYLNLEVLKQMQEDFISGAFDSEVLETNIAEKLNNLETQYAPKLTEVTTQLAQTDKTISDSGLDRVAATSKFLTNMASWIGLVNTKYLEDDATRLYILPKDHVTTGVGGAIKIFADAYQDGQDYRDLGIYFSADQNADTGYYGNGVNWINVKVLDGGVYAGKHPDLGFSFQDGAVVAGRISCYGNARAMWVFGPGLSTLQGADLIAEFKKDVGFIPEKGISFFTNVAQNKTNKLSNDATAYFKKSLQVGERTYINGVLKYESDANKSEIKNALLTSSRLNVLADASTIDVIGVNRVVINQPSTGNNISTITGGLDGQEIILINVSGNTVPQHTTIVHGTSIKLTGGANFSMGYNSTLTLICVGSTWYEKCRSVNA